MEEQLLLELLKVFIKTPREHWIKEKVVTLRYCLENLPRSILQNYSCGFFFHALLANPALTSNEDTVAIVARLLQLGFLPTFTYIVTMHVQLPQPNEHDLKITELILPYQSVREMTRLRHFHEKSYEGHESVNEYFHRTGMLLASFRKQKL